MSQQYAAIGWNPQKRAYDSVLVAATILYLATFFGLGAWLYPTATAETLVIRAFGSAAFLLLNVVLSIGPCSRCIFAVSVPRTRG